MTRRRVVALLVAAWCAATPAAATASPRTDVAKQVARIRRADYAGDREQLQRLYAGLAPATGDAFLASRVAYWRGFALWRRAVNGFNDGAPAAEQERDATLAIEEFQRATAADSAFVDAMAGEISCLGILIGLHAQEPERLNALVGSLVRTGTRAVAIDRDNPRLLWVQGPGLWFRPAAQGGGQDRAMAAYTHGLATLRARASVRRDPLEPRWGEPELLMSLAWSNLNRTAPDVAAAERDARAALRLVPQWHYVRDILLPQIAKARAAP